MADPPADLGAGSHVADGDASLSSGSVNATRAEPLSEGTAMRRLGHASRSVNYQESDE
jgi:hypothetical protein